MPAESRRKHTGKKNTVMEKSVETASVYGHLPFCPFCLFAQDARVAMAKKKVTIHLLERDQNRPSRRELIRYLIKGII